MSPDLSGQSSPPGLAGRIRVLVVDDSATQRAMLMALLNSDPELEVVGWAADGAEAVQAAARLKPDVIAMDLRMPVMDGLEATRRIMQETPTPIILCTSSTARADHQIAFEALQAGVLAVMEKPTPDPEGTLAAQEFVRTIKGMAQVKVIRRWAPERLRPPSTVGGALRGSPAPRGYPSRGGLHPEVVAIGASTGGPQALREILSRLPALFSLPVLVVQHIAPGFVVGLVEWLTPQCALPVHLAVSGTHLNRPGIYVAPTGQHLFVRGRTLALADDPPVSGHRPSATVLFQSIARVYGNRAIGVLLSGMGDDGAAGLGDLKRAGGVTIAQDEASSVVFGMPGVAIGMGVVDHVLPPPDIAPLILELSQE